MLRLTFVLAAMIVPAMTVAQTGPTSRDDFCREMLDLTADLLTKSTLVMGATAIQGFEETGDLASSDPRVEEAVSSLAETVDSVADQVIAFCSAEN